MEEIPKSVQKYIEKMEKEGKRFSKFSVVPDRWSNEKLKVPVIEDIENVNTAFELKEKLSPIYGLMQVVGNSDSGQNPIYLIENSQREREWDYPYKTPYLPVDLLSKLVLHDVSRNHPDFGEGYLHAQLSYDDSSYDELAYGVEISGVSFNDELNKWTVDCRAHYKALFKTPEGVELTNDLEEGIIDILPDGTHHDELNQWILQEYLEFSVEMNSPAETSKEIVEACKAEMAAVTKIVMNARAAFEEILSNLDTEENDEDNEHEEDRD